LELSPWDWTLLGEVSEFLNREVRDYTSALAFARAAISLNAITSTWLWNLFGDAFQAIARGLSRDATGMYRERLLETQRAVLGGIAAQTLQAIPAAPRSYERLPDVASRGRGTEPELS
jgi:hypothetical protein